jgi:hypothetical protein
VPSRLGRLLTDVRPLQTSRDYRRLWIGNTVSQLGQQMTAVTIAIQVYALTRSTFSVGLVGLFALVPLVTFGCTAVRSRTRSTGESSRWCRRWACGCCRWCSSYRP